MGKLNLKRLPSQLERSKDINLVSSLVYNDTYNLHRNIDHKPCAAMSFTQEELQTIYDLLQQYDTAIPNATLVTPLSQHLTNVLLGICRKIKAMNQADLNLFDVSTSSLDALIDFFSSSPSTK